MTLPTVGSAVPRRGNPLTRCLGKFVLRLGGWRLVGGLPDLPRMVVIVAPHTSNWDFVIGVAVKLALALDAHWLGKHTLFETPLARLLYWLRGIPVDRSAPQGLIGRLVAAFRDHDRFLLALAPEGTRDRVARWKTGFYFVAQQAGVPIVPVGLDYRRRKIVFFEPVWPSGRLDEDLAHIQSLYRGVTPRYPERCWDGGGHA